MRSTDRSPGGVGASRSGQCPCHEECEAGCDSNRPRPSNSTKHHSPPLSLRSGGLSTSLQHVIGALAGKTAPRPANSRATESPESQRSERAQPFHHHGRLHRRGALSAVTCALLVTLTDGAVRSSPWDPLTHRTISMRNPALSHSGSSGTTAHSPGRDAPSGPETCRRVHQVRRLRARHGLVEDPSTPGSRAFSSAVRSATPTWRCFE